MFGYNERRERKTYKWKEKKGGEKEKKTLSLYMFGKWGGKETRRRCNLFLTCKGKRKEKNKKFIEEIIFKYKLEFRIDNRNFF